MSEEDDALAAAWGAELEDEDGAPAQTLAEPPPAPDCT